MDFLKKLFQRKPRVEKIDVTKRFDLIGRVGSGSMSKVWRARDTKSGRIVGLKLLDKEKTLKFEGRFDPRLKKPSEGEIALSLKHPHIVQTYEYGWALTGEMFLVMEFIEGLGMSYLVDVQNEQMQTHRLTYLIQLGEALQYFHERNFIHRDLCPRNILVSEENQVKLIDFGLAVPNTPPFQAPGNRTGTANYMAPELVRRQRTDQRIDLFSYAVTAYEMYARTYPWEAGQTLEAVVKHINSPPTNLKQHRPEIDDQVARTIMRGLEKSPADRWQSAKEMVAEFRAARTRLQPAFKEDE
jgi:serine/threonine protein kinase